MRISDWSSDVCSAELLTTLALGLPGSAGMAVLLGGFLLLGLEPGPNFLSQHMDIAIGLAIVLAVANLLAVVLMVACAPLMLRVLSVDRKSTRLNSSH